MSDEISPRDFGDLEAQVRALKELVVAQSKTIGLLVDELAAIKLTLSEARGGWKTLVFIAGAAAAAAGLVTWVLQHLTFKVGP
jgi:hypothetical protein